MTTMTGCSASIVRMEEKRWDPRLLYARASELFWGVVSLLLFMILGPFAAPAALWAIFSLESEHRGRSEPEPAAPEDSGDIRWFFSNRRIWK